MIPISDPDLRRRTTPYVTVGFIALNLLVFVYQLSLSNLDELVFTYKYSVIPAELTGSFAAGLTQLPPSGEEVDFTSPIPTWATMFSSMFLHGGFLHLAGNMVILWVFGDNIEDRFGHLRYLVFYLAAGTAAVWAQTLVSTDSQLPIIGASGAIAGVMGAYLLLFPHSRITTLIILGFVFVVRLRAIYLLGVWTLIQAFNGIGSLGIAGTGGVAYFAHLGGLVAGLAVAAAYRLVRREPIWPPRYGYGQPRSWRPPPDDDPCWPR
jgi:membrane associated rhomboid family serine protease